jgi:rhodanese-related sulfurtransferase
LASIGDNRLKVRMLDVRSESDFNLFHIEGAQRLDLADLLPLTQELLATYTENTVYVVMSNDETRATEAWKVLVAESVPNVYILEGGINYWLSIFAVEEPAVTPTPTPVRVDQLRYVFPAALGSRYESASPSPHEWELEYTPKIKLQIKRDKSGGGCG